MIKVTDKQVSSQQKQQEMLNPQLKDVKNYDEV